MMIVPRSHRVVNVKYIFRKNAFSEKEKKNELQQ